MVLILKADIIRNIVLIVRVLFVGKGVFITKLVF